MARRDQRVFRAGGGDEARIGGVAAAVVRDQHHVGAQRGGVATQQVAFDHFTDVAGQQRRTVGGLDPQRSEEHTSELQSLMRISYAVFCLKKKKTDTIAYTTHW